jgi:hypothetical protein
MSEKQRTRNGGQYGPWLNDWTEQCPGSDKLEESLARMFGAATGNRILEALNLHAVLDEDGDQEDKTDPGHAPLAAEDTKPETWGSW